MLKRLELVGFKSFADKTVFEFPDGITAIVGPNGSGKSNIVDAVRWILGEQSAKSLRGGEMADVIFNGSSSRRSLGLAEVTMTFDNSRRHLALDAEEVRITRRVYRSSEGEYLINGQISRLKDIKEMFLGTGAGNDDLCIIAQGKVDVLLQASNKDRRTIFEEAAGISRFKAKKLETLRKLERVDQNLARVKDIIEEVEKQHRSVKLQATKAQRFQEHSNRLKELRLALGAREYGALTAKLDAQTQVLNQLKSELDQRAARAAACEAEAERLEMALADIDDQLHVEEASLAQARQQIMAEETTSAHEMTLTGRLESELQQTRSSWVESTQRVRALAEATRSAEASLDEATQHAQRERAEVLGHEARLEAATARISELNEQITAGAARHFEAMRRASQLQNEVVASKAQVDNLCHERARLQQRADQTALALAALERELQELEASEAQILDRLKDARHNWQDRRAEQDHYRDERERASEALSTLRQDRSAIFSRLEVLEGLIKSHEGLSTGVREVIEQIEKPEPGPWSTVIGMIADFLTVKREYAPLIDLALGDWAQRFVVRDCDQLVRAISQRGQQFSGRVSFLPLVSIPTGARAKEDLVIAELKGNRLVQMSLLSHVKQPDEGEPTPEHPGLVAPAEQLVSCEHPELTELPAQLLGRTLIVRDLATARAIAEHAPGFRLVTLQGELLEADGSLTVGIHHAETGILARKSELRELREQLAGVDARIAESESQWQSLRDKLLSTEAMIQEQQETIGLITTQETELRSRISRHQDRRQILHEEAALGAGEMRRIESDLQTLESAWRQSAAQAAEAETLVQTCQALLTRADADLQEVESERQLVQQEFTQAKVSCAQAEERLRSLQVQYQQLARDHEQRRLELGRHEEALASLKARIVDSQRAMLAASALLAQAYLIKEHAQQLIAAFHLERERKRQERSRLTQQAQAARNDWRAHQETVHKIELEASELRHQRDALVQRLKDDYQIDVADWANHSSPSAAIAEGVSTGEVPASPAPLAADDGNALDPEAAQVEIDELRRKLARLGNVNMEALAELQDLERRSVELETQFTDLTSAKNSLEEIIAKINVDSKRLFLDTFAVVRTHFQELFRKLFGGGMADAVLEDENDVLESGIDIIARPPGKELRSISLMSGGEKTLTAVALLMAVFKSKPSPFCLLDEVDAALDEANIGRFTAVLREFSELSQFIVVTHSKKTMASADTLYGITMQESGISKQVTIRFNDWVEEQPVEKAQAS